jgi:hypothetical protein
MSIKIHYSTLLKKIIKNFLISKEIQKGLGAKTFMTNGLLSSYMTNYLRISSYILGSLCTRSLLNILIYEENFLLFFYSAACFVRNVKNTVFCTWRKFSLLYNNNNILSLF